MYFVDRCLVCDSGSLLYHPAVTSPFIAQIVRWTAPQRCSLAECAGCGHRFFDPRLDEAEMERLYRDYRGREYFAIRHRWEPWYTEAFNEGLGHDQHEIDFRRGYVLEFLRKSEVARPPVTPRYGVTIRPRPRLYLRIIALRSREELAAPVEDSPARRVL